VRDAGKRPVEAELSARVDAPARDPLSLRIAVHHVVLDAVEPGVRALCRAGVQTAKNEVALAAAVLRFSQYSLENRSLNVLPSKRWSMRRSKRTYLR
jgi:hypothetical protein